MRKQKFIRAKLGIASGVITAIQSLLSKFCLNEGKRYCQKLILAVQPKLGRSKGYAYHITEQLCKFSTAARKRSVRRCKMHMTGFRKSVCCIMFLSARIRNPIKFGAACHGFS